jgi:hypothetical protein
MCQPSGAQPLVGQEPCADIHWEGVPDGATVRVILSEAKNLIGLVLAHEIDSLHIIACGNDNAHDDAARKRRIIKRNIKPEEVI